MTNHPNRGPKGLLSPPPALLRELRDQACITQAQAAVMCRAGLRTWQQWEAGDRAMPAAAMELFALALAERPYIQPHDWIAPWVRPEFVRLLRG